MSLSDRLAAKEAALAELFHKDLVPWARQLFSAVEHAEVVALLPVASNAAGALAAELATNRGDPKAFAASVSKVLANAAAQAEAVSGPALLAAVTTAIVAHGAAVGLGGEPTPAIKAALNPDEQAHAEAPSTGAQQAAPKVDATVAAQAEPPKADAADATEPSA